MALIKLNTYKGDGDTVCETWRSSDEIVGVNVNPPGGSPLEVILKSGDHVPVDEENIASVKSALGMT